MVDTVYYIISVPKIVSTTRFNHALGIAETFNHTELLTHDAPPEEVASKFTQVKTLEESSPISRIREAIRRVNERHQANSDMQFVTTGQIEPVLAGWLANADWTVDLYDDPLQGIRNDRFSRHQVTDRLKKRLVESAPIGVNTLHPDALNQAGRTRRYCVNGAPTDRVKPQYPDLESPIHVALAGKAELGKGMGLLIDGIQKADVAVQLDAIGETTEEARRYAREAGVADRITFHGRTPHSNVLDAIAEAHVGICVLPDRADWQFQYPIKVGEYLAAGTVPLISDFPGLQRMCGDAAEYVDASPAGIAEGFDRLAALSPNQFKELAYAARQRGERIAWKGLRREFARKTNL